MKRLVLFAVVFSMVATSHGAMLARGSRELAIEGLFDSDTIDGEYTDIAIFYGEYPEDNIEVGLTVRLRETDNIDEWRIGARADFNNTAYEVVPFLALTVEYANIEIDTPQIEVVSEEGETATVAQTSDMEREKDAIVVGAHAGLKWFIAENVAVSGALVYEWADEEIFETEEADIEDTNIYVRFGMRFLF